MRFEDYSKWPYDYDWMYQPNAEKTYYRILRLMQENPSYVKRYAPGGIERVNVQLNAYRDYKEVINHDGFLDRLADRDEWEEGHYQRCQLGRRECEYPEDE